MTIRKATVGSYPDGYEELITEKYPASSTANTNKINIYK